MVFTKLPQELRDAIYSHIVPGPSVSVHRNPGLPTYSYQTNGTLDYTTHSWYRWPYRPDGDLLSPKFSVELCAYFYQHNQFDFGNIVKPWPSTMTIISSVKNMSGRVDGHVPLHRKEPNSKEMCQPELRQGAGKLPVCTADCFLPHCSIPSLFYLIFVHLFALSRQASYRLPFAIDRLIEMIHPKLLRLTKWKTIYWTSGKRGSRSWTA
jgi:hypothetical protein